MLLVPEKASGWTWLAQSSASVLFEEACDGERAVVDELCPGRLEGSAKIVAVGNPILWLTGVGALVLLAVRRRRDPLALILVAVAGVLWIPWLVPGMTTWSFTAAPLVPVLIMATALALARARWRIGGSIGLGLLASIWFVVNYTNLIGVA